MRSAGDKERQRVGFRALCLADNAGASRRRSGAASISRATEDRRKPARSWSVGVNRSSTGVEGAARHPRQRNQAVQSGARSVGRLQRSVRSIFPVSSR